MDNRLSIHLYQSAPQWESASESRQAINQATDGLKTDLLVLPEFFTCGFSMNPACAEPDPGPTLAWMLATAARIQGAVTGSIPVRSGEQYVNRLYFCKPDGSWIHYDKKHIFSIGDEGATYTAGSQKTIVHWRGWNIRLSTCYDLRFPVWLRNQQLEYDLLLNVAAWPSSRIQVTEVLTKARAIENQCYAIFCNRVGDEPTLHYNGGSCIMDYLGNNLIAPTFDQVTLLECQLSLTALQRYREKFPAWKDQDSFSLTH
ncbi:MAG: nitrilase family protein [Bacteroidales bacterium]|nr:nitrilase family protein [Bacteroidales bacterium]